jgi:NAD(P)-dependent dehydrogenase (short-subunit alcohol dehydrogenase family)
MNFRKLGSRMGMDALNGKNVVVIGASEGLGRKMIEAALGAGARALAVARRPEPLAALAEANPGLLTLSADAAHDSTPERVLQTLVPDVLVICAGATPHMDSLQDQTWDTFSRNWESDVRASFNFCKTALTKPLAPGSAVVLISSGAGLVGSPRSGGYAGAKRMQMFLAEYAQEESQRMGLGVRFLSLVPKAIIPTTALGKAAVEDYARYRGMSEAEFMARFDHPPTSRGIADALITLVSEEPRREGTVFAVDGVGITEVR